MTHAKTRPVHLRRVSTALLLALTSLASLLAFPSLLPTANASVTGAASCRGLLDVRRVSARADGTSGNAPSWAPDVSADGSKVVFGSDASTLDAADGNGSGDVFQHTVATSALTRASVGSIGEGNDYAYAPSTSSDGNLTAFHSAATNLLGGNDDRALRLDGTNGLVYLPYGMLSGSVPITAELWFRTTYYNGALLGYSDSPMTKWQPVLYVDGAGKLRGLFANGTTNPIVSAGSVTDGRWHHVVLAASASLQAMYLDGTLVDTRTGTVNHQQMHLATVGLAYNTTFPSLPTGWRSFNGDIDDVSVSWKWTTAPMVTNHYSARTTNYRAAVLADGPAGFWPLADAASTNVAADVTGHNYPGAFSGTTTRRVPGALTVDGNSYSDIFVRDTAGGTTARVSKGLNGTDPNSLSLFPDITPDGRYVAFMSYASNLVSPDSEIADVFVYDRTLGTTTLVSRGSDGVQRQTQGAISPSISANGRYVAFTSNEPFVSTDGNGTSDVYVRDLQTNTTSRASVTATGASTNDASYEPRLSDDGRWVTFSSYANNLVSGDNNGVSDVFLKDRVTGAVTRLSTSTTNGPADGASFHPSISGNNRYVAYQSAATNLVGDDHNNVEDYFVYDRTTNTQRRISFKEDGTEQNSFNFLKSGVSLSGDGLTAAYVTNSANVTDDGNQTDDVYVVNLADVADSEYARFIAVWSPRLANKTFMDGYLFAKSLLNDGFNSYSPVVKQHLVNCLVDQDLKGRMPGFNPTAAELAELRAFISKVIFEPQNLPPLVSGSKPGGLQTGLTKAASGLPAEVRAFIDALQPISFGNGSSAAPAGNVSHAVTDITSAAISGLDGLQPLDLPALPALVQSAGSYAFDTTSAAIDGLQSISDAAGLGAIADPLLATVSGVIGSAKYRLCYESPYQSATCSGDLLPTVPFDADITGDGTNDVRSIVTPIVTPIVNTANVTYQLERLSSSEFSGQPLRANVWLEYDLLGAARVKLGYDGFRAGSALSQKTVGTFEVRSLSALSASVLDIAYDLEQTGPATQWALTAQISKLSGTVEEDPTAARAAFTPVPTSMRGELKSTATDSTFGKDRTFKISTQATTATSTHILVSRHSATRRLLYELRVADIPTDVNVQLRVNPVGQDSNVIDLDAETSATIGEIAFRETDTPDLNAPTVFSQRSGIIHNVADQLTIHAAVANDGAEAQTSASAPIGATQVAEIHNDAAGIRSGFGLATSSIPATANVAFGRQASEAASMTYQASDPVGELKVHAYDRDELAVNAALTGLPNEVAITKPANANEFRVDASEPLGSIDAQVSLDGGRVVKLEGEHATIDATDGKIGASVTMNGLRTISFSQAGTQFTANVGAAPGGNTMRLLAWDGPLAAAAGIVGLPAAATVTIDAATASGHFTASGPIQHVSAYASNTEDGPSALLEVENLPAEVTMTRSSVEPLTLQYTASAATGRTTGWFSPDPVYQLNADNDRHLLLTVGQIPASVSLAVDMPQRQIEFHANSALQNVVFSARGMWGLDKKLVAIGSIGQVPTHWTASAKDGVNLTGVTGPIGPTRISLATNGVTTPTPSEFHLTGYGREKEQQYYGSIYLPEIRSIDVSARTNGVRITADAAVATNLTPFVIRTDFESRVQPNATKNQVGAKLDAKILRLPSLVDIASVDGVTTVDSNAPFEADVDLQVGWLAALARTTAPEWYHGISFTDGACRSFQEGCDPIQSGPCAGDTCLAAWARLELRGLPTRVSYDSNTRTAQINNLSPPTGGYEISARAAHIFAPMMVSLFATITGVQPATNLTIGPIETTPTAHENSSLVRVPVETNKPIGNVRVAASVSNLPNSDIDTMSGEVTIEGVPTSMDVSTSMGEVSRVTVRSSSPIPRIDAQAAGLVNGVAVTAVGRLTTVPTEVNLDVTPLPLTPLGAGVNFIVPKLAYTANDDTLDGFFSVDPGFNPDLEGFALNEAAIGFVNLGRKASAQSTETIRNSKVVQQTLQIVSTPATPYLWANASVSLQAVKGKIDPPVEEDLTIDDHVWGRLRVNGEFSADLDASGLLELEDVADLTFLLNDKHVGLGIDGTFGKVAFNVADLDADLDIDVDVRIDKPYLEDLYPFVQPWFHEPVRVDGDFKHLMINVLHSPRSGSQRQPMPAVCLDAYVPVFSPGPVASVGIQTYPAPLSEQLDRFEVVSGNGKAPYLVGFFNPATITRDSNGTVDVTRAEDRGMVDVALSQLGPFQTALPDNVGKPKIDKTFHALPGCLG